MADRPDTTTYLWPSAEQELLLTAALGDGAPSVNAFREWQARVDLMREFHPEVVRLLPLVYANMQRQGVDDPVMARLKGAYRRSWYDTNRLFHTVQPAIAALTSAGINVLLLKGAPLAIDYYGNAAHRPMGDVDLMVSRCDLDAALKVLRSAGWRMGTPLADDLRFRHAVQCLGPDGGEMDVHWHVVFEAASDDADRALLAASEPVVFLGSQVQQLDPTSLLFLVLVHGVRWNEQTPVRWIPDAMMILRCRGAAIDWDRLVAFAQARRLTHRLGLGLEYLVRTLDAPVPSAVVQRLRTGRISRLERIEQSTLLSDNRRLEQSVIGTQWLRFVDYLRYADTSGPIAFLNGFTHYLRYRMALTGRRQMFSLAFRRMRRWATGNSRSAAGAALGGPS
jgi:hypothetical protein